MSAYSPCINYSDSKFFKRLLKWFQDRACLFRRLKEQVQFQTETKPLESSLCCGERHGFVCCEMKGKAAGFRSRLSTPPGVNQAIPPKLMSPKRLIGSGLFRVLLIGSHKHGGLYLIGSGTALGRMKDWDLSAAPKSNLISDSPFMSLLCLLSLPVLSIALLVSLRGNCCNALIWLWAYLPRHRFCKHHFSHNCM